MTAEPTASTDPTEPEEGPMPQARNVSARLAVMADLLEEAATELRRTVAELRAEFKTADRTTAS